MSIGNFVFLEKVCKIAVNNPCGKKKQLIQYELGVIFIHDLKNSTRYLKSTNQPDNDFNV